jgi:hypothetical protein
MARKKKQIEKRRTRADVIRKLIRKGWTATDIAKRIAPEDPRKQKIIQNQVYRVMADDPEWQAMQQATGAAIAMEAWPGAVSALARRSMRGRTDAIKLQGEVSGFHNPRIQHEHSGDINLKLVLPRPPEVPAETYNQLPPGKSDVVDGTADVMD